MKIDMEKPENAEFASKYPVSAYPTLMFIDKDGKIALKQVGAQQVDGLLELGKKALGSMDKIEDMDAAYAEGNRDPKFLFDYVKALNRAGKPSLKYTNEYLATQKDLSTEFNRRFLYEGAVEADSRVYDLLLQQRAGVATLVGKDALDNRIEQACRKTVKKAVEFRSETLLAEAKEKMKAGRPDRAESFNYEADMAYFSATKDSKKYLKAATGFQKVNVKNAAAGLHRLVHEMLRAFPDDPKVLEQAASYAETAAENGGLPEYYLTLADIYKRQGKRAEALKTARKGLEVIGEKQDNSKIMLENFIKGVE
jgi:tetratricopeptide (TPR) repeat protein